MHILTIIGARPQFIKAAAISRILRRSEYGMVRQSIVHTGQHYDSNMSGAFFTELGIPEPDINLAVGSASHGAQTGAMMRGLEDAFDQLNPDLILVYGDTNSTLAGALVAAKSGTPLAHVEAGLRSYRVAMPEEVNRVVADRLSDHLFCPTQTAVNNLHAEGRNTDVHLIGDVMYDVFLHNRGKVDFQTVMNKYKLELKQYVLASVHRAENTDSPDRLLAIFTDLQLLAEKLPVIIPVHPRTKAALEAVNFEPRDDFIFIPPVPYGEMLGLVCGARALATDSGGLQKEAYFAETPCVTLRDETEWVETLSDGWNTLAPPISVSTVDAIVNVINCSERPKPLALYGDGTAADKILSTLVRLR